ncbi:MAG: HEPN domain-containing protein [Bacteroidetes bacterium]|nr:HEPN domain-containing protein [Bacteroidota bacterium]MBU2584317.1 HEPN domain-containing protein [Bacteroidota bacterium]
MIHLSIEKVIKGIYAKTFKDNPPKTHHLLYLIEKIQAEISFDIPEEVFAPIREIDKVSIPVRYPDNLNELSKDYSQEATLKILKTSKEVLRWLKSKLNK